MRPTMIINTLDRYLIRDEDNKGDLRDHSELRGGV